MVITVIKRMQSRDKDQTWKTGTRNIEHKITKIMHTEWQKQMSNSDSTKSWEHGLGSPVGLASSAFQETPAKLFIKSLIRGRQNSWYNESC